MPEDGKNIDKKKEDIFSEIAQRLTDMSNEAYKIMMDQIENELKFDSGKIVAGNDFVKRLNILAGKVLGRLQDSPTFNGPVSKFVKRMPEISQEITKFQSSFNSIKVPAFETTKKVIIDEIINAMLDNGLNQNFVQPLRDLIYRNATTGGLSLSGARELVKDYIKGGKDQSGKLKSYIDQTAQQGVDMYSGAINKKLMETFNYNGMLITGTIIDHSSPQCRYSINDLGGTIKRSDWPDVKAKANKKFPLIEGTTFDNLPIMLLHWGCRHGFYPIML